MKQLFTFALMMGLSFGIGAQSQPTTVTYTNNSGQDLVLAFALGAAQGQQSYQTGWLNYDSTSQTYNWKVPQPSKATDLKDYIFTIKKGASITIAIPAYTAAVGFRCLVADPIYRTKAFIPANSKTKTPAYMAFPDMMTDGYLFDKFEAGLTVGSPGIWNITAVDFVAIPMQLSSGGQTVGFKNGVTASGLFAVLNQLGNPYNLGGSVTPNTSSNTLRYFSPANIGKANTVLDSLILAQAAQISGTDTVKYGNYVFYNLSGSAARNKNSLAVGTISAMYSCATCGVKNARSITVNDVTTVNALAGTIVGAKNANTNDSLAQIQLGAILSAAICRGILSNPELWGDIVHYKSNCAYPWNYYPSGVQSDFYSKVIHQYSIDSKNYGFPYDDYFGDEAGFTVLPGDAVNVNLLPLKGTMTAKPNGVMPKKEGCLMITTPDNTIYPNSTSWPLGELYVEGERVISGANVFCSLPNDTIHCTFSSMPNVTLNIYENMPTGTPAYAFIDQSDSPFQINGITNMYYDSTQYNLTFANTVNWEYSNSWTINLPPTYPAWSMDTLFVNGTPLVSGVNGNLIQNSSVYGDTVICTFSSQPGLEMCLIQNQPLFFRTTTSSSSPISGISGIAFNSANQTLTFGSTSAFMYANAWTVILPSKSVYPSGATWQIGTISVNGKALTADMNTPLLPSGNSDTLVCTFSASPKLEMCLIPNKPILFRNSDGSACNVNAIVGLASTPGPNNTITFGPSASFQTTSSKRKSKTNK